MPSLQFYLGYPLRVASGEAAARLINLAGFPVVRDGTLLTWQDHAVFIDAPCSGVKMLWAGLVLAQALSALRGHGPLGTAAMAAAAFGAVALGNIMRTTALFFLETGVVHGPAWAHSAVGVAAFIAAAGLISWMGRTGPRRGAPWGYKLA
jgi:exosortase/archaeosortase family protein